MSKVVDFYQKIRDGKYEIYNLTAKEVKEIGDRIGVNWDRTGSKLWGACKNQKTTRSPVWHDSWLPSISVTYCYC